MCIAYSSMGCGEGGENTNGRLLIIYMLYHFRKGTPLLAHENVPGFETEKMKDTAEQYGYRCVSIWCKPHWRVGGKATWVQVLEPAVVGSKSSSQNLFIIFPCFCNVFHHFSLFFQCFSSVFIVFSLFFLSLHCFFNIFHQFSLFFQCFSNVFHQFALFFHCFFQCFSTSNMYISIHITFSAVSRTHLSAYRAATGNGSPF